MSGDVFYQEHDRKKYKSKIINDILGNKSYMMEMSNIFLPVIDFSCTLVMVVLLKVLPDQKDNKPYGCSDKYQLYFICLLYFYVLSIA